MSGPVWLPDCLAGHVEARTSELAFKLRTKPIGVQEIAGERFALGNCHHCRSTIGYDSAQETEVPSGN